jgi:hypothetical protein
MVDEVLGVDLQECMAQYVVAAYMISAADRRAEAVRSAIAATCGVALLWWPISEMERAAVEPLPALDEFLRAWQAMVAEEADGDRGNQRGMDADRWLGEVIERREGAAGLAKLDRRFSRRVSDSARDGRAARLLRSRKPPSSPPTTATREATSWMGPHSLSNARGAPRQACCVCAAGSRRRRVRLRLEYARRTHSMRALRPRTASARSYKCSSGTSRRRRRCLLRLLGSAGPAASTLGIYSSRCFARSLRTTRRWRP